MNTQRKHGQETLDFIRKNIDKMRYAELGEALGISAGAVNQLCIRNRIKKSVSLTARHHTRPGYHVYTTEEDQWALQSAGEYYSIPQLARAFNEHFGTDIKKHSLEMHFRELGICKAMMKPYPKKKKVVREPKQKIVKPNPDPKQPLYSAEEELWMKQNIGRDETYLELTEEFNQIFGRSVPDWSFSDHCRKIGLRRENDGRFISGQATRALPILQEVDRDGYIWIKVENDNTIGAWKTNWVQKHRYIYEQVYGQIPEGYIVIFLDSNRMNFEPDNLYAVPRSIHARMTQNHWYTESKEHTMTAIRLCELNQALKSVGDPS